MILTEKRKREIVMFYVLASCGIAIVFFAGYLITDGFDYLVSAAVVGMTGIIMWIAYDARKEDKKIKNRYQASRKEKEK